MNKKSTRTSAKMPAQEKCQALEKLTQTTRELIDHIVQIDAATDEILALEKTLSAINSTLSTCSHERPIGHYDLSLAKTDTNRTLPYSPICGPYNPIAPPVDMRFDDESQRIIGTVICQKAYEGPPGMVHGGIITAIYDQLLALVSTCSGQPSYTAYLHTTFIKPTPLYKALEFSAWAEKLDGRKLLIKGHCTFDDEIVTECEGLFIQLRKDQ